MNRPWPTADKAAARMFDEFEYYPQTLAEQRATKRVLYRWARRRAFARAHASVYRASVSCNSVTVQLNMFFF
jgi:hypothetical protein